MDYSNGVIRITTWIALAVGAIVTILMPFGYYWVSYQSLLGRLDTEAEINAWQVTGMINANPDLWRFEELRFGEFLKLRPREGNKEIRRVIAADGTVVAESIELLTPPLLTRSYDLKDAGVTVGRIEIIRSLSPLLLRTGVVVLFGIALGVTIFVILRVLPLRAVIRAESSLQDANRFLLAQTEELSRSNTELEQFAYAAAHDLQEPLRMVVRYVQLLENRYKGKLDPDADSFIAFTVEGVDRLKELLDALLTISMVGAESMQLHEVNCEEVWEEVRGLLKDEIKQSGVMITCDPLPVVMANKKLLIILFEHLVVNALKFRSAAPPLIHVGVLSREDDWIFSVRDNGIGIAPQYFERIFQLFQRLHRREDYLGTGAGLSTCKKIVERHGGRIWLESTPGQGTTFFFTIPSQKGVVS